jgi:hypothetical protein
VEGLGGLVVERWNIRGQEPAFVNNWPIKIAHLKTLYRRKRILPLNARN